MLKRSNELFATHYIEKHSCLHFSIIFVWENNADGYDIVMMFESLQAEDILCREIKGKKKDISMF